MIKLTSTTQAEQYRSQVPDIVTFRMTQLQGTDGLYDPDAHGWVIIVTEQDDVENDFPEVGSAGLLSGTDDWPIFDYVEYLPGKPVGVFEAVVHLNNEQVIAYFVPAEEWLDPRLRSTLERAAANH